MKKMNNKGFSLVELIIVIAIMAILVGVLAPQFIKYVEQSRESTDISTLDECKKAAETFVADYNPGGTIEIKAAGKGAVTISATPGTGGEAFDATRQAEYGIDGTSATMKSTYSTITWTYDATNFSWTASGHTTTSPGSGKAPYYNYETGEKW
jgi:type IV pilus assembly protein PilA